MKLKRRRVFILAGLLIALSLGLGWVGTAVIRVKRAHIQLMSAIREMPERFAYSEQELKDFFANAELALLRSASPLLRAPWRSDVRLYYLHNPRINTAGCDAWAYLGPEGPSVKIHN
ncbi:MAG: hypothetical protein ACYS9X_19880 [Planctomycetota bacterium]